MALESAQLFVVKMREDKNFRQKVSDVADRESLWDLVKNEGFDFDERDLAGAMAACMTEMEGL
ncbi:MAG: Nif11-like leader peptide family natural product precursor [Deltaproteobacteria bacterium]|jgi:predicted ribosomally synthesized peptide with nif11-like leader|nr:Nif11-like leader peptide family natural product precursor [Deltaproteobacteria bacterium]